MSQDFWLGFLVCYIVTGLFIFVRMLAISDYELSTLEILLGLAVCLIAWPLLVEVEN